MASRYLPTFEFLFKAKFLDGVVEDSLESSEVSVHTLALSLRTNNEDVHFLVAAVEQADNVLLLVAVMEQEHLFKGCGLQVLGDGLGLFHEGIRLSNDIKFVQAIDSALGLFVRRDLVLPWLEDAAELDSSFEAEGNLGFVHAFDAAAEQVVVADLVELLLVVIFGSLPLVEVMDLSVTRQHALHFLEVN